MSTSDTEVLLDRRAAMRKKRESKRPSRAGVPAGTSEPLDYPEDPQGSGFTQHLTEVIETARVTKSLTDALSVLLTLDGEISRSDGLRALDWLDKAALEVTSGPHAHLVPQFELSRSGVHLTQVSLDRVGRLVITSPLRRVLGEDAQDLGLAMWVEWTAEGVAQFESLVQQATAVLQAEVNDCRRWLESIPPTELGIIVAKLRNAVLSVPPVQLNRGRSVLSNFRDETNLTGKTLSPSSPQCFFTGLASLPLSLWTDDEAVIITCLWLLYLSGGPHRIESMNGVHLDLGQVWDYFRHLRAEYQQASPDAPLSPACDHRPALSEMIVVAHNLNDARTPLVRERKLAHRIVGATRSKREFVLPPLPPVLPQELEVLESLAALVPGAGSCRTLADVREVLRGQHWLIEPTGDEPTGLEALIATVVTASVNAFKADFALSRGLRDYPALVAALEVGDLSNILAAELPAYYCCVVPSRGYALDQGRAMDDVTDTVWSMSARMQYNTWHVIPGNLPQDKVSGPRDYFAPQTLPDIADNMHFFHRGHKKADMRHTLRSPECVMVKGVPFRSLADLRLVRVSEEPFTTLDLAAVTRIARLMADYLEDYAKLCEAGPTPAISSFDSTWHRLRTRRMGEPL